MGVISETIQLPIELLRYVIQAIVRVLRLDRLRGRQPAAITRRDSATLSPLDTNPQDATIEGVRSSERIVKDPGVGEVTKQVFAEESPKRPTSAFPTLKQEERGPGETPKWEVVMADESDPERVENDERELKTERAPDAPKESVEQRAATSEPAPEPAPSPPTPSDKLGDYVHLDGVTQMQLTTVNVAHANKAVTAAHCESTFEPPPVQHLTLVSPTANAFRVSPGEASPTAALYPSVLKPVQHSESCEHQLPVDEEDASQTTDELDRVSIESVISDDTQEAIPLSPLGEDPPLKALPSTSQSPSEESAVPKPATEDDEQADEATVERVLNAVLRARDQDSAAQNPASDAGDSSDDDLNDAEREVLHALPPFLDSLVCMSAIYQVI
ncbi:hypothetical protein P43SY_004784 [Pythium insidiosum]|uniref:Uncharacterized protein n=1 Tax=Pythium insidiosum TaxID=114742 RepID=A0AAD5M7G7_PYTIN|nr:hypothetical protein P43SY_004784 [Pythium insidiosum]